MNYTDLKARLAGPVTQAAKDLIDRYFGNSDKCLATIPADPKRDADLILIDGLKDALAAIEELEARNQWQPIETAPHDTEILVLMEGEIYQASLYTKGNGPNEWIFPMAKHHGYWCRSGDDDKPTHWMPRPQPPEQGQ